jgi:hypothetical protein
MAAIKKESASDDFVLSTTDSVTTSGIKTENSDQQDGVVKMEDVPTHIKTDQQGGVVKMEDVPTHKQTDQQDGVVKMEDVPTHKKTDKNPVMQLNELIQGLKYDLISDVTQEKGRLFTMGVNVKGVIFEGTGNSKKAAKMAAAQTALLQLFNTVYCPGKFCLTNIVT